MVRGNFVIKPWVEFPKPWVDPNHEWDFPKPWVEIFLPPHRPENYFQYSAVEPEA